MTLLHLRHTRSICLTVSILLAGFIVPTQSSAREQQSAPAAKQADSKTASKSAKNIATQSTKTEWHLVQYGEEFGKTDVYITADAARVSCKRMECELLIKAPDYKVHCFNTGEKLEWIGDLSLFNGLVMANPFSVPRSFESTVMKKVDTGDLKGLKYTKFFTGKYNASWLCTADAIQTTPQVAEFLSRFYFIPSTTHVPLQRVSRRHGSSTFPDSKSSMLDIDAAQDLRSGTIKKLDTLSWQKIPYTASDFAVPSGYKRAKDIIQVSYSANRRGEMNEMLDNIGFSEASNKLVKDRNKH